MNKLGDSEINEYFEKHLPYRIRIMLAHYKLTQLGRAAKDDQWLAPCFEASVITGRLMLNVLGVFKRRNDELYSKKYREYEDDAVNAEDLGGTFVDANNLPENDKRLFERFIRMADKACAHLTTPQKHEWQDTHEAIRRICHYLRLHLFRPAGRPCLEIDEFLDGLQTTVLVNPAGTDVTVITRLGPFTIDTDEQVRNR
ncbi:MAG: hypothetical protein ABI972_04665 [Acidobacteriota bacterium]